MAFFSDRRVTHRWHNLEIEKQDFEKCETSGPAGVRNSEVMRYPMSPSVASSLETIVAQHGDDFSGCIPCSARVISISKHVPSTEV